MLLPLSHHPGATHERSPYPRNSPKAGCNTQRCHAKADQTLPEGRCEQPGPHKGQRALRGRRQPSTPSAGMRGVPAMPPGHSPPSLPCAARLPPASVSTEQGVKDQRLEPKGEKTQQNPTSAVWFLSPLCCSSH